MPNIPSDTYTPQSQNRAGGKSVLIITADKTEDLEFFYPYYRFIEAGYKVDVVTPDGGKFEAKHGLGLPQSMKITDVDPAQYDLLYIPGGKAPAQLIKDENAVTLTKKFVATGKPVAAICHGPQLLAAAGVIKGKRIAAWPEVQPDVEKAGGIYIDRETEEDAQFITARWPADLPAHLAHTMERMNASSMRRNVA